VSSPHRVLAQDLRSTAYGERTSLRTLDSRAITLKKGGKEVTKLNHGTYIIKVADKLNMHNLHLKGPGVNKETSVPKVDAFTWNVTLKKGKYRFVCDPHASSMKASFKVT